MIIVLGVVFQVLQVYVSIRNREKNRDATGDPWNGRNLEWSVASPAPFYNFAILPTVEERDQFWVDKQDGKQALRDDYQPIHMPKNTAFGFWIAMFAGLCGFALIWQMWIPGVIGFIGAIALIIIKTFIRETDYIVDVETIRATELAYRREK